MLGSIQLCNLVLPTIPLRNSRQEGIPMAYPVLVRLATIDDLDFVAQDHYIPRAIVQRKIEEGEVFVAVDTNQLVGYARLEQLWSLIPYIALIHVLPTYRRQGVGTALLAGIGATLRERGHTILYSSSQVNEPEPQAWHRRMGFEECGVIAGINDGVGEIFFRTRL